MKPCAIIHYAEIGLKGKNRNSFESQLKYNIETSLRKIAPNVFVKITPGRFLLFFDNSIDTHKICNSLKKIFGIQYFSIGYILSKNIHEIEECILKEATKINFETFCIRARRVDKNFPLTSQQINEKMGGLILEKFPTAKVKLEEPDATFFIEILFKDALIYVNKVEGQGGLPSGISGKVLCLLSGGIDSPVASFLSMKRGCKAIFLHFHSYPLTDMSSIEKVKDIVRILSEYQGKSLLFLVPFAEVQKEIVSNAPPDFRVILYRRFMLRVAERLMNREGADAIVTGDSLGQVASQTLSNLQTIQNVTSTIILRPIIGFDKLEIINLAKKIETYEISIRPHQDSCSYLMPKNPVTHSSEVELQQIESHLNVDELIKKTLSNIESLEIE